MNDQVSEYTRYAQIDADSRLWFERENDRNQTLEKLKEQITDIKKFLNSHKLDKIIVIELDMSMKSDELFFNKIQWLSQEHVRIDLKYRGIESVKGNWLALLKYTRRSDKFIWFHMNGIRSRYINTTNNAAQRVALQVFGISTSSLGAIYGDGFGCTIAEFDPKTYGYNHISNKMHIKNFADTTWIRSLKNEMRALNTISNTHKYSVHINNKSSMRNFVMPVISRMQ